MRIPLVLLCLALTACASVPAATAPARGDLRIVVVSDLNSAYGSTTYEPEVARAVALIRDRWRPDLVLAAGDLIAGQKPALSDDQLRAMWAAFDSAVARPLRQAGIPFGFTLGNHDASPYPAHSRDRSLALEHWRNPAHRPGLEFVDSTHFPLFYSFRQGGAFVAVWDAASSEVASNGPMLEWLRGQLASEPARSARLRLVLGHLPLHAVAEGRNRRGEVLQEPDSLRLLLERHGVHTYVSGHHHAYYPGRRGALELLHAGALGQGQRPLIGATTPSPATVTILDVDYRRRTVTDRTFALLPDGGLRLLNPRELPERIEGVNGYVVRRDLRDGG